jgi:hypothetical protein
MSRLLAAGRQKDCIAEPDDTEIKNLPDYFNVQSIRNVVLMGWLEGPDNEENNKLIGGNFFGALEQLAATYYNPPRSNLNFSFRVTFPMDLKAHQTCMQVGGGSAITDWFCCFCNCRREDRGLPSLVQCGHCIKLRKPDGYCRHKAYQKSTRVESNIAFSNSPLNSKRCLVWVKNSDTKAVISDFLTDVLLEDRVDIQKMKVPELKTHLSVLRLRYAINIDSVKTISDEHLEKLFTIFGVVDDAEYDRVLEMTPTFFWFDIRDEFPYNRVASKKNM